MKHTHNMACTQPPRVSRPATRGQPRSSFALLLFALVWCLICVPGALLAEGPWDSGPIFDDYKLTLGTGHRTEIAGPFYYSQQQESRETWALPPFFSQSRDPETEYKGYDFLYPILTYDRYGDQYR